MSNNEWHRYSAELRAQQDAKIEREIKWLKDWLSTGNMPAESFWFPPSTPNPSWPLSHTHGFLQQRQIETRRYDGISETDLLTASTNVLQDLGFIIENSETELGVITASKKRDITDTGEIALSVFKTAWLLLMFFPVIFPVRKDQTIRASLVVRPVFDSNGETIADSHFVRATFQSIVRDTFDKTMLVDSIEPETYQGFFKKLSKSVFLEAQEI
jgi:hypothetical protein